jgi:hypothetical protein
MSDHTTNEPTNEIPYGYCQCGCGQKTWIPAKNESKHGYIKGVPVRFFAGHGKRKLKSLADELWSHCVVGDKDACWEWQGGKTSSGYGQLYYRMQQHKTHRLSYELHYGPIPGGMSILHKCDNPPCCNPNHLCLGTRADNVADMCHKKRNDGPRGEECHTAKLTESDIPVIRQMREDGMTLMAIAAIYGISSDSISHVVRRKTWKHVP